MSSKVVKNRATPHNDRHLESVNFFRPDGQPLLAPITCAGAIGTAAKTTTSPEPEANSIVNLLLTNGNSANSPTVAFNGGTARPILLGGTAATGAKCAVAAGGVITGFFDGTSIHLFGTYT